MMAERSGITPEGTHHALSVMGVGASSADLICLCPENRPWLCREPGTLVVDGMRPFTSEVRRTT